MFCVSLYEGGAVATGVQNAGQAVKNVAAEESDSKPTTTGGSASTTSLDFFLFLFMRTIDIMQRCCKCASVSNLDYFQF